MRVLVVGAGPAGARVAERVAERAAGAAVTLVGEEPALPYDRVALGRALSGEAEVEALITHPWEKLRGLGIAYRPSVRVAAIDRAARQALTTKGEAIGYDRLVLATGSRAVRLPLPGADLPGVFLYRTLADVQAMARAAAGSRRAVVVGGGLLGLEAAACLARRGLRVTVVHPVGWPMERQLCRTSGGLLARWLARGGIDFAMPAATAAIEGEERVTGLRLVDGRVLPAEIVVLAVGVRPDASLAAAAGLPVNRAAVVDDAMRTADPDILAVGECAEHAGTVVGLVAPALAMAEAAAWTVAGEARGYVPKTDAAALKVSGVAVWSGGEVAPKDAEELTAQDPGAGHFRRFWLRDGRLVGAVLYGDAGDAGFYLDLIASGRAVGADRAGLALGPDYLEQAA
ncbi:FAD-dependent oxidoreductase [Roseomonas sp. OT10]|uniref:NAD(P)/FAD-dependent oxidoreductase n=1 Tax=Roseomonas cutis TaxID=2897332 RepID=UPI001E4EE540|nr:FAD-dependent oxidoreductase [Roseomonas sp. OT10]UFN48217.1 FAD-dependent oxidoreductase [Roseomonas sp. OT10]